MKVLTEAFLRNELHDSQPEVYYVPPGAMISPAGREYLMWRKIKIAKAPQETPAAVAAEEKEPSTQSQTGEERTRYVDHATGACYFDKPEHMTRLYGNVLVPKDHPRIVFRGKLDEIQALIVLNQTIMVEEGCSQALIADLDNIVETIREIVHCDLLQECVRKEKILGMSHKALRECVEAPVPHYSMGKHYAMLNQIRVTIRKVEIAAIESFREGDKYTRKDIVETLNALSSALNVMMSKYLAGEYK